MSLMKLTDAEHERIAEQLFQASLRGDGVDPPSATTAFTLEDAYRIRRKFADRLIAAGGAPRGHKIGFTSEAMQKMYGMSGPDFGQLMDWMFVPSDAPAKVSGLSDTRVEPELAFELATPLAGPGVTLDQALAATAKVWPAIEVIDSRVGAMRATAQDSISDNAGAGLVVLGETSFAPDREDLADIPVSITVDGETLDGVTGDVMGHPAAPLAWLANKLAELDGLGGALEAGDIVLTGSCTRSTPVRPGSELTATFGPLGALSVSFV